MPEGQYVYLYPRPMVTVDAVILTIRAGRFEVLLIRRKRAPFLGMWALPGGFLEMDEEVEVAAARELQEETGVTGVPLVQFGTFGAVDRDPRGRVITIAYLGLTDWRAQSPKADDDAADCGWLTLAELPPLASDHNEVIAAAVRHLRLLAAGQSESIASLPATWTFDVLRGALDACSVARL